MRALILAPFSEFALEKLSSSLKVTYESWLDTRTLWDPEKLAARLHREDTGVLVVESDFVFEEMFDAAPRLRFVGICRGATNQIDVDAATERGVLVVNTPGRNANAVAEHTLALMLALARRIPEADLYVRDGRWRNPTDPYVSLRGRELSGSALGIIGLGVIGKAVGAIGLALGMRVVAHDPYLEGEAAGVEMVELEALLTSSDFVVVSVPLTDGTAGLIDGEMLALMKPASYLISATDMSVFDREALLDTLQAGRIAGAAFDVFETHPVSPGDPLLKLDNVVLTPHIGGATHETIERHSLMMAEDILRFQRGCRPLNLVNPAAWQANG
ncbi:MAG: phosphoglycerate dehydrogenase [Chloroflexi bacterium]|nr:phosphoglycerate dehydrogenase [Chloroflexota bacterium]